MIGESIGAYTIVSELGRGGVGVVYLAQHRHLDRKVAIKFLQAELSNRTDLVQRFFTEARAASMIEHQGIVRVLDCDVHPSGHAYIVMEYLVGDTLRQHLARRRQLLTPEAAAIMIRVADALAAAHAMGIVHRDLKPDNIFVLSQPVGAAKIVDFGVAKLTRPGSSPLSTLAGTVMGTPLYMSPEQARGVATLDARADVYSLGCILFELLCGRPPFVYGDAEALLAAHLHEVPPAAHVLEPSVPGSLSLLVERMLAKSPDQRARLTEEVIPTLAGVLTGRPTLLERAEPAAAASVEARARFRRRAAAAMSLAVVAAAALAAGVWLSRTQDSPHPPAAGLAQALAPADVARPKEPALPAVPAPESQPQPPIGVAERNLDPAPTRPEPPSRGKRAAKSKRLAQRQGAAVAAARGGGPRRQPASAGSAPGRPSSIDVALTSDPAGALICLPGVPARVGSTNSVVNLAAGPGALTVLLYRRGFHVEKVVLPSDRNTEKAVKLRALSDDDLQAPPPCR